MATTTLLLPAGLRGDISLRNGIGQAWGEFITKEFHDGTVTPGVSASNILDIHLGCLMNNWSLTETPTSEQIPFSCTTGMMTIDTDKNYTVSVDTRNVSFALKACLMGLETYKDAVAGTKVTRQEESTGTVSATPFTIALNGATVFSSLVGSTDIKKILSVYNQTTKEFWSEGDTADSADRTFTLTASPTTSPLLTFTATEEGDIFTIKMQYQAIMGAGDWMAIENGTTFAEECNLTLSWLIKVESGPDKGNKGYMIAEIKHAKCTSPIVTGGDTKAIQNDTLEFSVNFQDSGDIKFSQIALS